MSKLGGAEEYEDLPNLGNSELDELLNSKVLPFELMSDNDWWRPIVRDLGNPTWVTDWKIKYRALSYVVMGNGLLKKTPEGILLKCFRKSEDLEIYEVHRGSCGSHQAGHKMK